MDVFQALTELMIVISHGCRSAALAFEFHLRDAAALRALDPTPTPTPTW